ncbi:MAG: MFS transporter [Ancalomicrobiaceae bacterium]|nr:MFS transporter [Ancalomicrobiaceae bacterium]
MPLVEPRYRPLFLALFSVFTLYGTSMTIIGATLPKILADFGWSYLVAGLVLGAGAVAYFSGTFVAGYLLKLWGPKQVILLGLAVIAVGLAFFATTPVALANILLNALIGIGQGCVEVGVNWLALRIDTANNGRPMNLMHGAFAIGAILGPFAVGLLLNGGFDWINVYRGMAVIVALLIVVVALLPMRLGATAPTEQIETQQRLSVSAAYWLSFLALFFYVGVELGVSNWVAEYFVAVFAYPPADSAQLVSLFWAGLLAGRFGVPLLYSGSRQDVLLIGLSIVATASISALSLLGFATPGAFTHTAGILLVFFSGLGCSIYYPAVITLIGNCFPHAQSQAVAFAATGGGVGSFVFPFLMSALASGWGIRAGFATYAVFAIAMTFAAAGLVLSARQRRKH